ncbi:16S rRNA (guanine(527)-N(7))-methyltransferase RsmG [Acetobacteraceae bacterium H6797]|nr:16S rRNA (guanine(527)-N(7))-methyltransferase RsmG [Acetobacteraceae bacterium H6797]
MLVPWNARINLVATRDPEEMRRRHIGDSLQLLPLVPPGDGPMADLGSGGGFPGLILAIALGRPMHLVESDKRKSAFLTAAAAHLGLKHVTVHPKRIEAVSLPPVSVLSARALAPLSDLLPHAHRLLADDGVAIFPKGRTAAAELTAIPPGWQMEVERFSSRTDPDATILRLSRIHREGV